MLHARWGLAPCMHGSGHCPSSWDSGRWTGSEGGRVAGIKLIVGKVREERQGPTAQAVSGTTRTT